jgi:hypothetical protein
MVAPSVKVLPLLGLWVPRPLGMPVNFTPNNSLAQVTISTKQLIPVPRTINKYQPIKLTAPHMSSSIPVPVPIDVVDAKHQWVGFATMPALPAKPPYHLSTQFSGGLLS